MLKRNHNLKDFEWFSPWRKEEKDKKREERKEEKKEGRKEKTEARKTSYTKALQHGRRFLKRDTTVVTSFSWALGIPPELQISLLFSSLEKWTLSYLDECLLKQNVNQQRWCYKDHQDGGVKQE